MEGGRRASECRLPPRAFAGRLLLCWALSLAAFYSPARGQVSSPEGLYDRARDAIHRSEYAEALRLGERALVVARQSGDRRAEARAHEIIGNACFYLDRHAEAVDSFRAGLAAVRELGDPVGEATALKDIGITSNLMGRFDEGFDALHESLEIFRRLKDADSTASALENLGMGYANVGAYRLAFEMYGQSLQIARETGDAQLMFGSLIRLGILYLEQEEPRRALEHLKQANEIAEREGLSPVDRAWAMQGLSLALSDLGRDEEAAATLGRALALCRRTDSKACAGDSLVGLGYLSLERDPAAALVYLLEALPIFEQIDYRRAWGVYAGIARAYRRQGHLDSAAEHYQGAVERLEALRDQITSSEHRATFMGKHQRVYQELIETLMERHERGGAGDDARAFDTLERAKARAMLDAIAGARLGGGRELEPGLRLRLEQVDARIAELHRKLFASEADGEESRLLLERLSRAEEEFGRALVDVKRREPRHAALHYPRPLTLGQAQGLLDESTALLAYAVTERGVFAFLLTGQSFHAVRLAVEPRVLSERAQNYVDLVSGVGDGWRDISRRLYADLVAPLRGHLPPDVRHLVIAPDGPLHFLPFDSLLTDGGPGRDRGADSGAFSRLAMFLHRHTGAGGRPRHLLEDYRISYTPSATVLAELRTRAGPPRGGARLLVLADPSLPALAPDGGDAPTGLARLRTFYEGEGLQVAPIPFATAEADALARYAGPGSEVHTGAKASERLVKGGPLESFRVIHFATHGLVSQRAPARSALMLAREEGDREDGFLQAREVYRLKLASDMVVLSGCRTARGRVLAGEGIQGLAQAFFYAGAQTVVASLWDVNDERTAELMAAFYRHLAAGGSKAESLRAAKLELMRGGASPRHWAAFVIIGEADAPVPLSARSTFLRHNARWLLACAALFLAALPALYLLRWRRGSSGRAGGRRHPKVS